MNRNRIIKIIIILIGVSLLFLVGLYKYSTRNYYKINSAGDSMAIYIKADGAESYTSGTTIPVGFYELNTEKTKCSNGAEVKNYDSDLGEITVNMPGGTVCSLYFDEIHVDSDVSVAYSGPALNQIANYKSFSSSISCGSNTASYDGKTNSYYISVSSDLACIAQTTGSTTKNLLSDTVRNLVSTTATNDDWRVVEESDGSIRYKGINPDNYVWFNDELWRIIGNMNANQTAEDINELEDDVATDSVKIIRANLIDTFTLTADDDASDIYWYLEDIYMNRSVNPNNSGHNTLNATKVGLKTAYSSMIQEFNFASSVSFANTAKLSAIYSYVYDMNNVDLAYHINLLNPADYFYAMADWKSTSCTYDITNNHYRQQNCSKYNWLYTGQNEKTISGYIKSDCDDDAINSVICSYNGAIKWDTDAPVGIRPVVQLQPAVYIVSGDGTYNNPYILGYD